jgi:hypothetical protein
MATRKAAKQTAAAAEATQEYVSVTDPAGESPAIAAAESPRARQEAPAEPTYAADPHAKISVSLSDVPGGPAMHLLRSHKYKQMQVRFDREQPGEKYLKMLTDAGWRDRTQEEGVYTKQIDQAARWQSVAKMEQEFKAVANAIRDAKGLGPVLEGIGG